MPAAAEADKENRGAAHLHQPQRVAGRRPLGPHSLAEPQDSGKQQPAKCFMHKPAQALPTADRGLPAAPLKQVR